MEFSKRSWKIRQTHGKKSGPGPNYFSSSPECVHVNEQGHLIMKIIKLDGKWICSEVILNQSLGYGSYIFHVGKGHDKVPPQAVLGLFTYQSQESLDEKQNKNKQIDIQISTWGKSNNAQNSQYVIQPYNKQGNIYRFSPFSKNNTKNNDQSLGIVHAFTWQPQYILFQSYYSNNLEQVYDGIGKKQQKGQEQHHLHKHHQQHLLHPILIKQWKYENKQYIPKPQKERVHINFWLFNGNGIDNVNNRQNLGNNSQQQTVEILQFRFKQFKQ